MRRTMLMFLAMSLFLSAPLLAAENQNVQTRNPSSSGYESGTRGMGPGMMGNDRHMNRGMRGYGKRMGPDPQGWQSMSLEQREQWRQMRSRFMQETLPVRQELSAKQMELETLWEQKNPDAEKVNALSDRIAELRSKLDRKHDEYLTRCRQEIGDHGWACPGMGRRGY